MRTADSSDDSRLCRLAPSWPSADGSAAAGRRPCVAGRRKSPVRAADHRRAGKGLRRPPGASASQRMPASMLSGHARYLPAGLRRGLHRRAGPGQYAQRQACSTSRSSPGRRPTCTSASWSTCRCCEQTMRDMVAAAARRLDAHAGRTSRSWWRSGWCTSRWEDTDRPARPDRDARRPQGAQHRRHQDGSSISGRRHPPTPEPESAGMPPDRPRYHAPGRDPDRARARSTPKTSSARSNCSASAATSWARSWSTWASSRSATCWRRSPISSASRWSTVDGPPPVGARNRRALAPLPAPVPRLSAGAERSTS